LHDRFVTSVDRSASSFSVKLISPTGVVIINLAPLFIIVYVSEASILSPYQGKLIQLIKIRENQSNIRVGRVRVTAQSFIADGQSVCLSTDLSLCCSLYALQLGTGPQVKTNICSRGRRRTRGTVVDEWRVRRVRTLSLSFTWLRPRSLQTGGRSLDSNQPLSLSTGPRVASANMLVWYTAQPPTTRPTPRHWCWTSSYVKRRSLCACAAQRHPTLSVFIYEIHTRGDPSQLHCRPSISKSLSPSLIFEVTTPISRCPPNLLGQKLSRNANYFVKSLTPLGQNRAGAKRNQLLAGVDLDQVSQLVN
jgi:hypothetical protein